MSLDINDLLCIYMRGTKGRITEIDTYNNIQCERELQEVHNIQEREKKQNCLFILKSDISISGLVQGWQMCACQVPRGTGGVNVRHGTLLPSVVRCSKIWLKISLKILRDIFKREEQGVLMSDMAHYRRPSSVAQRYL